MNFCCVFHQPTGLAVYQFTSIIMNLVQGIRQSLDPNSKRKEKNFSPPSGFDPWSPGTESQCASHELWIYYFPLGISFATCNVTCNWKQAYNFWVRTALDKCCNFSHCKIDIFLSCSDSYTLELSLFALKAAISNVSCL